ncbi:hypothetical protein [Conexibacter sp. SYSU D00693]|uniref:cupredoxin domain-containing protein n=1 Tax=Conexibacter sp. SYSU D00693 TaxID=2812560 RepID=UPI00196BA398|nr:hypothetical protein [Conexibacter sp. SYSU D00693]
MAEHAIGEVHTLRFDAPGTFLFQCRLHAAVRGAVVVSDRPGDGRPSPDPDPPLRLDLRPPHLDGVRVTGRTLHFALDERAEVVVDVERRVRGRWRAVARKRVDGHVGFNRTLLPRRVRGAGRFRVLLVATDDGANRTRDIVTRFRRA